MGERRRDYMVEEGSNPSLQKQQISPNLSPIRALRPARMRLELHELTVAGSNPAGCVVAAVAQLVEHEQLVSAKIVVPAAVSEI